MLQINPGKSLPGMDFTIAAIFQVGITYAVLSFLFENLFLCY
ncbi:hypothetical protein [Dapis sp. BLCC M229]